MAQGRAIGRLEAALGVVGVLALATTYVMITGWNPVPGFLDWLERAGSLSRPETSWAERVAERPEYAVIAHRSVIVVMRGTVEVRDRGTGDEVWSRQVPWASVAGADSAAVVVAGRDNSRGYEVIDPSTGAVRWDDAEAIGVWTYRDIVLAMTCEGVSDCVLAGRTPGTGSVLWRTPVPGFGKLLAGVNQGLLGSRDLSESTVDSRVAMPVDVPAVLGLSVGGKVQVIHTQSGKRLREVEAGGTTRVVVVGGRILHSTAQRREGRCRYSLSANDPNTGRRVWFKDGYDLRTASGAGCEQRRDPTGSGGALAAIRGDNREVLLGASDGRELWVGEPGEQALATDGLLVLVRTADGKKIKSVDLGDGRTLWQQDASSKAEASINRNAVLIIEPGRVRALELGTGRLVIDARTSARVIGCGSDEIVLSTGRTIGVLPFGSFNRS